MAANVGEAVELRSVKIDVVQSVRGNRAHSV